LINNRQGGRRRGRGGNPPRGMNVGSGNRQDNRQRGNAAQLLEKYKGLARDSQLQGDRVQTEYFLQYADHYFRVLNEGRARFEEQRRQHGDYGDDDEEQEFETAESGRRDEGEDDGREEQPRREFRSERPDRNERFERPERAERLDRNERFERPVRDERPDRNERSERPERPERVERPERSERNDRNGEFSTPPRRGPRRDVEPESPADEARIALDSLPPAIQAAPAPSNEDEAPAPARARRPRRPRTDEEDIAPAA
jgi:hypothetical protein